MAAAPSTLLELTIAEAQGRMQSGTLSAVELTRFYLERIERLDREGPCLQAMVSLNPAALEQAETLDRFLAREGHLKGPLHGVPLIVKDQCETDFMPTSYGTRSYVDYQPPRTATLVQRLLDAGAIILGKTSMCDFAAGWFSFSSVTERTRNPYDTLRDAGGSSAGTSAGVAANFALAGIGEDTGGSIRLPASFNSLFGLRVTTGLISRAGFSPLVHFQDTPGPMARTVSDLARLLDVIVGYDPEDPYTVAADLCPDLGHFADSLAGGRISGHRIGVLKQGFGPDDADSGPVNRVIEALLQRLEAAGATRVEVDIPDIQDWIVATSLYIQQSRLDLDAFMASRPGGPERNFDAIYNERAFHPLNDLFDEIATGPKDPLESAEYYRQRLAQQDFQRLMLNAFARHDLDFMVYPDVRVLPPTYADLEARRWTCLTFPTNTVIASQSHLPALSMPAGFTEDGLPVGAELVGRPYSEARLLRFAAAIERDQPLRRAPPID